MDRIRLAVIIDSSSGNGNINEFPKSGEGWPFLEAAAGTTTYASPEARWLAERFSGREGLVSSKGLRGITLSYSRPGWGVGVLQR